MDAVGAAGIDPPAPASAAGSLHRKIDWTGAFWVASGVPALVLFSIGSIAATVGKPSWLVWAASILFGFVQSFTYAEIAGMFPHKSGGASVYGAIAWVRYGKIIAPLSVWCNWFAWSPVLAIGSGLGAGYLLGMFFAPDAAINMWQITLLDLDWLKTGLSLRINATFLIGAALMLVTFGVQHRGISGAARTQLVLGVAGLLPLLLVGLVPLLSGDAPLDHFFPLAPLAKDADGQVIDGPWDLAGLTLLAGGLFIAAWSTYAFETAVCYTREFRDPARDTFKAIFYSGLLCVVVFSLVPLAFQGFLGLGNLVTPEVKDAAGVVTQAAVYDGMLAPEIYSGMGVAQVMARMIGGGAIVGNVIIVMMILALVLSIMTAMAGSSRTLYQASVDGWLPRYLSYVNPHGAPTRAMWTDLVFNVLLLLMSDYVFVLAVSNVGYIVFNFLNLQAGWIHRLDRPDWDRPFRTPGWLMAAGFALSFVNVALMALGANVWGAGTLMSGLAFAALIVPVFLFRHYVQDRGRFPQQLAEDMYLDDGHATRRAGVLPYLVLAAGAALTIGIRTLAR